MARPFAQKPRLAQAAALAGDLPLRAYQFRARKGIGFRAGLRSAQPAPGFSYCHGMAGWCGSPRLQRGAQLPLCL